MLAHKKCTTTAVAMPKEGGLHALFPGRLDGDCPLCGEPFILRITRTGRVIPRCYGTPDPGRECRPCDPEDLLRALGVDSAAAYCSLAREEDER